MVAIDAQKRGWSRKAVLIRLSPWAIFDWEDLGIADRCPAGDFQDWNRISCAQVTAIARLRVCRQERSPQMLGVLVLKSRWRYKNKARLRHQLKGPHRTLRPQFVGDSVRCILVLWYSIVGTKESTMMSMFREAYRGISENICPLADRLFKSGPLAASFLSEH